MSTLRDVSMRRSPRLALGVVPTLVLFGCASTFQVYAGPRRPGEQVALIELEHISEAVDGRYSSAMTISMVDGISIFYDGSGYRASNGTWSSSKWVGPPTSLELLPGHHTISFVPYPATIHDAPITTEVDLTAGKKYRAIGTVEWKTAPRGSMTPTGLLRTWYVEIVEEPKR